MWKINICLSSNSLLSRHLFVLYSFTSSCLWSFSYFIMSCSCLILFSLCSVALVSLACYVQTQNSNFKECLHGIPFVLWFVFVSSTSHISFSHSCLILFSLLPSQIARQQQQLMQQQHKINVLQQQIQVSADYSLYLFILSYLSHVFIHTHVHMHTHVYQSNQTVFVTCFVNNRCRRTGRCWLKGHPNNAESHFLEIIEK